MNKKNKLPIFAIVALIFLIIIAVAIYLIIRDNNSDNPAESQETAENVDPTSNYPWSDVSDPQSLGLAVNGVIDKEGKKRDLQQQQQEAIDAGQSAEVIDTLQEQINSLEYDAFLTDEEIDNFLNDQQAQSYRQWVGEYYDSNGKALKELPELKADPNPDETDDFYLTDEELLKLQELEESTKDTLDQ